MKRKSRIFIIAPTGFNDEDVLHIVAKTNHRDRLSDIYGTDRYEEIFRTNSMKDALRVAKRHGAKRPTVI